MRHPHQSTIKIAWLALGINVITVLGGTLVRATGSGAGCGTHWPSCHGSLLPGLADWHTRVEFAHRAFSGIALLSVVALVVSVYRNFAKGSQARAAARLTGISIVVESLLGAWLVLARLVEDNATAMRAVSVPVHLVNTLFLLAALTSTAWIVTSKHRLRFEAGLQRKLLYAGIGLLALAATGAIAALADTLFPSESLRAGLAADFDSTAHFLTRLRFIHPIFAVALGGTLVFLASRSYEKLPVYSGAVIALVVLQLLLGVVNVAMLTPILIQVLHLLLADLLWIAVLILAAELGALDGPSKEESDKLL